MNRITNLDKLTETLFDIWLERNHPNFIITVGVCFVILVLSFIASLVCIWTAPKIWLPLMITTVGAFILLVIVVKIVTAIYVDQFNAGRGKPE